MKVENSMRWCNKGIHPMQDRLVTSALLTPRIVYELEQNKENIGSERTATRFRQNLEFVQFKFALYLSRVIYLYYYYYPKPCSNDAYVFTSCTISNAKEV